MTLPTPFAPMGALRQWITYRLESKAGKMDKVPCYWQTGNMADAHNPAHWTTYEQALANAHLANRDLTVLKFLDGEEFPQFAHRTNKVRLKVAA